MTTTDQDLLERAAKAAGKWPADFEIEDDSDKPVFDVVKGFRLAWGAGWWQPLHDDGDAFRLLLSTKLNLAQGDFSVCLDDEGTIEIAALVRSEDARSAAARRAIVRAAAAMAGEGE